MPLTESTMRMAPGTRAPDFALPDTITGETITLDSFDGICGLLVMFICRHCPYVRHVEQQIAQVTRDYADQALGVLAICSNDLNESPGDRPASLKEQAAALGFNFPYLYDGTQEAAKLYGAACTPDFFLFDKDLKLAYRGQLDDSQPGNAEPVDGHDLRNAIDAVMAGAPVDLVQRPSLGCNIKWKPDNEPRY